MNHLAYARLFTGIQDHTTNSPPSILHQQPTKPNLSLVKITFPHKGQYVQVDKDVAIYGTSGDNATTSDCEVSVTVNGIKPYQHTTPIGTHWKDDYSKWKFTLTPQYTNIKEGQNKITAKFSCANNPTLVAHNSLNVTGVSTVPTSVNANNYRSNSINNNNDVQSKSASGNLDNNINHNHPLPIIAIPRIRIPMTQIPIHLPFH